MSNHRVICDSDDDGEDDEGDFSPVSLKFSVEMLEEGGGPATATSATRSTDPASFNEGQFEGNQNGSAATETIPNTVEDSRGTATSLDHVDSGGSGSAQAPDGNSSLQQQTKAHRNLSSITDPVSRRKEKPRLIPRELSTQVTTPSQPPRKDALAAITGAAQREIYDFPGSFYEEVPAKTSGLGGGAAKSKVAVKTYGGKRKRRQATTAVRSSSPDPGLFREMDGALWDRAETGRAPIDEDEDSFPVRTRKRRKRSTQDHPVPATDDVDLLVIPRSEEANASTRTGDKPGEDTNSVVPDTLNEVPLAPFHIATSNLSTSQKQDYQPISCSSELEQEHYKASIPPPTTQSRQIFNNDATIPYTTPSRYNTPSMLSRLPELHQETNGNASSSLATSGHKKAKLDRQVPRSSPDELTYQMPQQKKSKPAKRTQNRSRSPEDHDSFSLYTSSSRKKRQRTDHEVEQQDETWNSNEIGYHRETYVPRLSRTRSAVDVTAGAEDPALVDTTRKKKQKEANKDQVATQQDDDSWDSKEIGSHRETYVPRPCRRKSAVDAKANAELPGQSMPDTNPPEQAVLDGNRVQEPILVSSGQEAPPPPAEPDPPDGIDQDYLDALPEDIRREVIADHLAQLSGLNSQASRTRSRGLGIDGPVDAPTQPKKRGRKKKVMPEDDDAMVTPQEAESTATSESALPAPAKRKRGRPKKSRPSDLPDVSAELVSATGDEPETPQVSSEPVAMDPLRVVSTVVEMPQTTDGPANRGRKKKKVEEPSSAPPLDDESAKNGQREVLQDISNTGTREHSKANKVAEERIPAKDEDAENQPDAKDDRVEKETTPNSLKAEASKTIVRNTGKQGKVPLRVGLSKRSRIAPLLKMIKK